jgi:putative phosphoribosyl transferase
MSKPSTEYSREVVVDVKGTRLAGLISIPPQPRGVVVFAHGSGSSRHSPRNRFVADQLNDAGFTTLLFDLLTPAEERNRENIFDVELLASRLIGATEWLATQDDLASLPVGYFAASTGAGAVMRAAADPRVNVSAVVSRGGRPDLAGRWLTRVRTPTLLIVGGNDQLVLGLNRRAYALIPAECRIAVIPHAAHLFEQPGAMGQVAELARSWFAIHLTSAKNLASQEMSHG